VIKVAYNKAKLLYCFAALGGVNVSGETVGLIAGAFVTLSLVPQVIRVFKLKSARGISLTFSVALLIGLFFWIAYGIMNGSISVILWNCVGAIISMTLLFAKLKYNKQ
jgi:MtN3 and saliva related transmembrane protein